METLTSASPPPAGTGDGIERQSSGYADQAPAGAVSPSTPAPAAEDPGRLPAAEPEHPPAPAGADSEFDWSNPAEAKRRYANLQGAFTQAAQTLARFGDLRGAQANLQLLESLKSDPKFVEWAKQRVAEAQTGSQDPETVRALDIVDQRAAAKAQEIVGPLLAPLYDAFLVQKEANVKGEMVKAYGPEWESYKGAMKAIHERDLRAGRVNPAMEEHFDFEYVQDLFLRAAGRDPGFHAKQANRALAAKQAIATSPHPGTPAHAIGTGGTARSLHEAFDQAKKQHGVG